MSQRKLALVGVSGVGKTTFLKQVAHKCTFQHLTAGSLISQARSIDPVDRDILRLSDLGQNQRLLIRGFFDALDPAASIVVLDGHVVIHSAEGLLPIDSGVFASLEIEILVHLEADPGHIYSNRKSDLKRRRPSISIDEICKHQKRSLIEAERIASDLGIEMIRFTNDDVSKFQNLLSELSSTTIQ